MKAKKETNQGKIMGMNSLQPHFFSVVNANQCDSAVIDDRVYLFFLK